MRSLLSVYIFKGLFEVFFPQRPVKEHSKHLRKIVCSFKKDSSPPYTLLLPIKISEKLRVWCQHFVHYSVKRTLVGVGMIMSSVLEKGKRREVRTICIFC